MKAFTVVIYFSSSPRSLAPAIFVCFVCQITGGQELKYTTTVKINTGHVTIHQPNIYTLFIPEINYIPCSINYIRIHTYKA